MITLRNVSKSFGPQVLLEGVSLQINAGDRFALVGPNGAGKSTLFKLIPAIERASSGSVIVNGQNVSAIKPAAVPFLRRHAGRARQALH